MQQRDRPRQTYRELAEIESQSEELKLSGQVPLEDDLRLARERREQGWQQTAPEQSSWVALWIPAGIQPRTPREMRAWLDQRDRLVQRADRLRTLRYDADALQEQIVKHSAELNEALGKTGDEGFNTILDRARSLLETQDQIEARRRELHKSIAQIDEELRSARFEHEQTQSQIEEWKRNWNELLEAIGLPPEIGGMEAIALVTKLEELFSKASDLKNTCQRIESIERDAAQFEREVRAVAHSIAPESLPFPLDRLVSDLQSRLTKAQTDRATLEGLEKQIHDKEAAVRKSARIIDDATEQLRALCLQAGCADHAELPAAEERSTEVLDMRKQVQGLAGGELALIINQ